MVTVFQATSFLRLVRCHGVGTLASSIRLVCIEDGIPIGMIARQSEMYLHPKKARSDTVQYMLI